MGWREGGREGGGREGGRDRYRDGGTHAEREQSGGEKERESDSNRCAFVKSKTHVLFKTKLHT